MTFWASISTELKTLTCLGLCIPMLCLGLPASSTSSLTRFVHLASLSSQFGMQLWVGIAGSTMRRVLPMHMFGKLQSQLFPQYFLISSVTSMVALGSYSLMFPPSIWEAETKIKGTLLTLGLVGNVLNALYFAPASIRVISMYQSLEKKVNHGHEVGVMKYDMSGLDQKEFQKYQSLRRRFAKLHGFSMLLNVSVAVVHTVYFYYLAKDMTIQEIS